MIFDNDDIINAEIIMPGFKLEGSDRVNRIGGGVCLYINSKLSFKTILKFSNSCCEVLAVDIPKLSLIIIVFYRPPSCSISLFAEAISAFFFLYLRLFQTLFVWGTLTFPKFPRMLVILWHSLLYSMSLFLLSFLNK